MKLIRRVLYLALALEIICLISSTKLKSKKSYIIRYSDVPDYYSDSMKLEGNGNLL